jgi:hypothetical protein
MAFVQDDVVPQDAAAFWRLQAEGVLLVLMLVNVCKDDQAHQASTSSLSTWLAR